MSSDVTLKHIAAELGISAMTVSRAINNRSNVDEKTREKVLEKAKDMGYTPNHIAKSLVSSKTYTIGVVIPEITHAFFPEVVRGIEEVTNQSDYQLFLTNSNEHFSREKDSLNALLSKRVDGILVSSSLTVNDYSYYRSIIGGNTKVVFFDRCIENIGASCISVNDRLSSQSIIDHLIEVHDFERIAYLSGPQKVSIGQKRFEGYLASLENHNIAVDEQLIIEAGFQEEKGYQAVQEMLNTSENGALPDAIAAVNDPCAIGAINALTEAGLRIPEDIAIVGFSDDIRAPLLQTPLTTVHQPAYTLGKTAAEKLIKTIEYDDEPPQNIEISTTLKIRASCGCSIN